MRRMAVGLGVLTLAVAGLAAEDRRLVYADFEQSDGSGRPVSSRGGAIQVFGWQENNIAPSTFKGLEGASPGAPAHVRTSKENENRAIAIEYDLKAPNQWAGVSIEIHGRPEADGVVPAEDVSGYRNLMLQAFSQSPQAESVPTTVRIEFVSRGHGLDLREGWPQFTFRARPGFNTYKVPLGDVAQPSWVETKVNVKDLLKKLTAVHVTVYCDQCRPQSGMFLLDNLVFEK